MYNSSSNYKRKQISVIEDEPPEKKLISDADLYIKHLSEKQRSTNTSLQEQLLHEKEFYKATEFIPLTSLTAGTSSLVKFNMISKHSEELEKLKSYGLCDDDITLYLDSKQGDEYVKKKYKNLNESVFEERLQEIVEIINTVANKTVSQDSSSREDCDKMQKEMVLASKPDSLETKLLKFALENERNQHKQKFHHPMDAIKDIEAKLVEDASTLDIKKIRKKARSLQNQIQSLSEVSLEDPIKKPKNPPLASNSKWDIKQAEPQKVVVREKRKIYTCKPVNFYTVKDGEIVKLTSEDKVKRQITLAEIKNMEKFKNYEPGAVSNTLYLKNLANGVSVDDLIKVFKDYQDEVSVKIMTGRMRGQAFVECSSEEISERILNECNGTVIKNKPIIIQFSKQKKMP